MPFDLDHQLELLAEVVHDYREEYDRLPLGPGEDGFCIYNNWFSTVDAEMLYSLVRKFQPRQLVEVGSGMSTLCTALALAMNERPCRWTAIDPEPRVGLEGLRGLTHLRIKVEHVLLDAFLSLGEDDILFIDSSHRFETGNDVDFLYNQVLPQLQPGVIVHVHDVFLPNDYPSWWGHRGYDEQTHLQARLNDGGWEVLWAANFVHTQASAILTSAFRSYRPGEYPGSFWMRRT